MKPHRVKRVDPQCRPGEFSSERRGRRRGGQDPFADRATPLATRRAPGALSPSREPRPVSASSQTASNYGKVPDARLVHSKACDGVTARCEPALAARPRTLAVSLGPATQLARSDCGGLPLAVRRDRERASGRDHVRDTLGQWPVSRSSIRPVLKHGPRSLTCARVTGARKKPRGAMKVKAVSGWPRQDPGFDTPWRTAGPSRQRRLRGGARAYTLGPERW